MMTIELTVSAPVELGVIDGRTRRFIPITAGTVRGEFSGKVVKGETDWQAIGPNGVIDIEARDVLELEAGMVEVESRGLRRGPPDVLARLAKGGDG